MHDFDCVVIGAGVIGLACARAMAQSGLSVLVAEQADTIGTGISSRNSEVIHAGIYYPGHSLKAHLCAQGRDRLYSYCETRGVAHRRVGKLVVATSENELEALQAIATRAQDNGVTLQHLSASDARRMEPALHCVAALFSPGTGIIDSHAYMLALQADGQHAGAEYVFRTPLRRAWVREHEGFTLELGTDETTAVTCRYLVNCAGLNAVRVARAIEGLPAATIPQAYYCKGSYFTLAGRTPFSHLIYPVPNEAGLGVHLTLDLAGNARFGPDTEWVDAEDYRVDPARADTFVQDVRRYWPGLPEGALVPGYAGIRPKIVGPGQPAADFLIAGPRHHGVRGLVNLFGIESPGLTASLAIADEVVMVLQEV